MAELGSSAEQYAYADPQSAIVKLRNFAESYVGFIYQELSLPAYGAQSFFERLDNQSFKEAVEQCVLDKLHLIRMKGNKAAHLGGVSINDALNCVKEAYFLAAWLYAAYHGDRVEELPRYLPPEPVTPEDQQLKQDKKRLQENLNLQTADLQQAKAELEAAQREQQAIQEQLAALNLEVNQLRVEALQKASQEVISRFDFQEHETRKQISMADVFAEYQLTEGQAGLVKQLDAFLSSKEQSVFLLKGYAGTGKTFITKGLTEYFRAVGRNYVLAAPTGKAAKVISRKTGCEAYTIHKTIYSMKNIQEYKDGDLDGSETYKFYAQLAVNELSVDTVYIIDEASMISDIYSEGEFFHFGSGFLLRDFFKYVNLDHNDHRKKVIFIGDNAQLPPIGMNTSPALDTAYLKKTYGLSPVSYELTEVVRQKADSGVMQNAIKLRQALQSRTFNEIDIDVTPEDLTRLEYRDLVPAYMQSCDGKINAESIVIAASNADVNAYNKAIREALFPGQPEIARRDKVMVVNTNDTYGFVISNGDFGIVRQVLGYSECRTVTLRRSSQETGKVETVAIPLSFRRVEVGFRDIEGQARFFEAQIIENLLHSDQPNLSSDENKALYVDFCMRNRNLRPGSLEFKETLRSDPYFNALRLKFGYAITCHKAQGSEWNHVFIKCKTHHKQLSADYFRWLYTAMTRTSCKLYLLEPPRIKLGNGIKVVANPGLHPRSVQDSPVIQGASSVAYQQHTSFAEVANGVSPEAFGLHSGSGFLLSIFHEVKSCIQGSGIEIYNIDHNQYQESYVFCLGPDTARINVAYNGKQKVSSIQAVQVTGLSNWLLEKLAPLKGRQLTTPVTGSGVSGVNFGETFLDDFHQRFAEALSEAGIAIHEAAPQQYSLRYRLGRGDDSVAMLIYYNSKNQFTKCNPLHNQCTSPQLMDEVFSIFQEGLA